MKKHYISPLTTIVELMEEGIIATSGVTIDTTGTYTVGASDEVYTREEVSRPSHDVWNEW